MSNTVERKSISYQAATKMVAGAIKKAEELGCQQNAAVVDVGGRLVAFGRMDGAAILGIEGCQKKAFTALFGIGTEAFYDWIKDDPSLVHGLSHFTGATVVGGGLPIIVDDEVVGGIGVGGGSVEEDVACAQAGLDVL
ncbi:MAG: heme-binding protein [Pseudomonadota bacterium]